MGRRNQVWRGLDAAPALSTRVPNGGGCSAPMRVPPRHGLRVRHGSESRVAQPSKRRSNRYSPCSVYIQNRPFASRLKLRARFAHGGCAQGGAANPSCHSRPPSGECAMPGRYAIQRLLPGPTDSAFTYWLRIVPITGSCVVVAPMESVITDHVAPSSQVTLIPSAVAI